MSDLANRDRDPRASSIIDRADIAAAGFMLALIVAMLYYVFRGGAIGEVNIFVEFLPIAGLLGEQLRSGELPLWNPYSLSGTPLAAGPTSGWLYLPVMVLFTLFSVTTAWPLFLGLHLAMASFGAYALARLLRMPPVGAVTAAVAYTYSGWFAQRVTCCPSGVTTGAMLPLVLLATELALRAPTSRSRLLWRIATGFALAQLVSAWFGQGAYYAGLAVGGYTLYRTLIEPVFARTWSERIRLLAGHLLVSGVVALGLAAGGLLPRFELYRHSNLVNGYPAPVGADWSWFRLGERLIGASTSHAGAVTVAMAAFGLIMLRRCSLAPFWFGLTLFGAIFSLGEKTPLHAIFYAVLPMFERVQEQLPYRILFVSQLGLAMLAGGVVSVIADWRPARAMSPLLPVIGGAVILSAFWLDAGASTIESRMLLPIIGAVLLVVSFALAPEPVRRRYAGVVPVVLLVALTIDVAVFAVQGNEQLINRGATSRLDMRSYFAPSGPARFLLAAGEEPHRFAGVDPALGEMVAAGMFLYGRHVSDPMTAALIVNNRAMLLGLEDIQGVNFPIHLAVYRDYMNALNGSSQDYHNATILHWEALNSPLLDLLGIRFIIVPQPGRSLDPPPEGAVSRFIEVYADDDVRILENPAAAPRAWMVHEVRAVAPGEALPLLASGDIDGRRVALIDSGPVPEVSAATYDSVTLMREGAGTLRVEVETDAAGLLIFSEVAHPGWRVTVDGREAELRTVDHTFVGVAVPAGSHEIVLTFEARLLKIGSAISLATLLVASGIAAWIGWGMLANHRRRPADHTDA